MLTSLDLHNCVILDCETTGISESDEIIELAIIRAGHGQVLFYEQFRPLEPIDPVAEAIHGISDKDLIDKPRFSERFDSIMSALPAHKTILGWRVGFDKRMFEQTICMQGCKSDWKLNNWLDVQPELSFGHEGHLTEVCQHNKIPTNDLTPHHALSDCRMVYRLLHHNMASRGCKNAIVI